MREEGRGFSEPTLWKILPSFLGGHGCWPLVAFSRGASGQVALWRVDAS